MGHARAVATKEENIVWTYSDDKLSDVARRMFDKGLSQLPVRDKDTSAFVGIISELSILREMLLPRAEHPGADGVKEWRSTLIEDAGVIESVPWYPSDSPLRDVAQLLVDNPAILLDKEGVVTGIITRADFLKLLFDALASRARG